MSSTLKMTLIIALVMFCSSGKITGLPVTLATYGDHGASETSKVTVTFEGLMVFHDEKGGGYELGILQDAPDHKFTIKVEPAPRGRSVADVDRFKKLGNSWLLEVRGSSGELRTRSVSLREKGHSGRLTDSLRGQSDFSWIMDLESSELHSRALNLVPDKLGPIIHLRNGDLYTKYKADLLERKQGVGEFSPFGFVAETVALEIHIQRGERLVLKVANAGKEGEIFELSYDPLVSYRVAIANTPIRRTQEPGEPSHFHLYYDLFSDVSAEEEYEIRVKEPREHAFNDQPHLEVEPTASTEYFDARVRGPAPRDLRIASWITSPRFTCCGLECNPVLLGKRANPLH